MNRPYVICHMLTSLDGKIDGPFMSAPETVPTRTEYGRMRATFQCQATMYGTTTMEEAYAEGRAPALEPCRAGHSREDYVAQSDVDNYIVSVDPEGVLGWASKYIEKKGRPRAHVIEVLTRQASDEYLAYLRGFDISYIFAGEKELDCALALRKLKELFHIDRLILAGGAVMNASLLQEGLIDELSILVAPVVDGGDGAALFRRGDILPERPPKAFALKDIKQLEGNGLWLRYLKQEG